MIRSIVCLLLVFIAADSADACQRCGLFGRRCKFAQSSYYYYPAKQQVRYIQQQVAVPQQIINISNVYPQGSTAYASVGSQQQYASVGSVSATLVATPPAMLAQLAAQRGDNADANFRASITLAETTNARVAEIARIQATTAHLRAGLSGNGGADDIQNLTLRITKSAQGIKVEKIEQKQQAENPAATVPDGELPPPAPSAPDNDVPTVDTSRSIVHAKCARCHGMELASPKARLYVDVGATLDCETSHRAIELLYGKDVPDEMKKVVQDITPEERDKLIWEITSLVKKGGDTSDPPAQPSP